MSVTQQWMLDTAVDMALTTTARMFGLPRDTVTAIVQIGLPMMARMAETNHELLKRMYAASCVTMPEPIQDFYARMAADPAIRQSAMDDYKAAFGAMLDTVNRAAARQAGTTDGQAREVIAASLPAVNHALRSICQGHDQEAFARALRTMA